MGCVYGHSKFGQSNSLISVASITWEPSSKSCSNSSGAL
jgi:hypothetical protein